MPLPLHFLCCLLFMLPIDVKTITNDFSSATSCQTPRPLGMESGEIGDDQLSASSSFDESLGPQNARIRREWGGGAWCPRQQIDADSYEYIQVQLLAPYEIWTVEVQGRYGNGSGREFAQAIMIDYIRPGQKNWTRYSSRGDNETSVEENQVFAANYDERTAELIPIVPPLMASSVRLVPFSAELRTVCIRFELYGCLADGLSLPVEEEDRRNVVSKWSRHIRDKPALLYPLALLLTLLPFALFLLILRRLLRLRPNGHKSIFSCSTFSSSRTSSATSQPLRPSSSWQNVLLPFPFDHSLPAGISSAKIFSPSFCRFDTVSMGWPSLKRKEARKDEQQNDGENWSNGLGEHCIIGAGHHQQMMMRSRSMASGQISQQQQPTAHSSSIRTVQVAHSSSQPDSFVTRPISSQQQSTRKPIPKPRSILLNQ